MTRRIYYGMLFAIAVPLAVAAAVPVALLFALALHLRVLWALGKMLARGGAAAVALLRRHRWPLEDRAETPAVLALPPRR